MNQLVANGIISEFERGANFSYVLSDNSIFLSTEYKVLQSQTNGSFIKCMKMLYNGKIELFYLINSGKSFSAMLPQLEPERLITIIGNLFSGILAVKTNGFLSCQNIDSSFEHIYVDQSTYNVGLVYLPLSRHEYDDAISFENALRANLVRVISNSMPLKSAKLVQLVADLQNGMLSLEELSGKLSGKKTSPYPPHPDPDKFTHKTLKLVAMNAPDRIEIVVGKPEFSIGKKDTNDGIITFNKLVSRVHCKITCTEGRYYISDLQSANGTYVNGERVLLNQKSEIRNGDVIRLANSEFRAIIG